MTTRTRSATLAKPTPKSPVRKTAAAKKPVALKKAEDVVIQAVEPQYPQVNSKLIKEIVEVNKSFLTSPNFFNSLSHRGTNTCSQAEINGVNSVFSDYYKWTKEQKQAAVANKLSTLINQKHYSNIFFNWAGSTEKSKEIEEIVKPLGFKKVFECMGNHGEPVHTFMTTIKKSRG